MTNLGNMRRNIADPGFWGVVTVLMLLSPEPLAAGNHTRWITNYYDVTGSTIREIRRSIMRDRPAVVDREALTGWNVRSRYSVARFQGAYRCGGFTTTTTIRMVLPRWTPPEGVADSVREEWERYITALTKHEQGHAQFALSTAGELNRRVAEVGTEPNPVSLKSRVDGIIAQTIQEFHQREREYDRLTRHGLEQGAVLAAVEVSAEGESPRRGDRRRRGPGRRSWRSEQ